MTDTEKYYVYHAMLSAIPECLLVSGIIIAAYIFYGKSTKRD